MTQEAKDSIIFRIQNPRIMKITVTALLLIISLQLPAQKRKTYFPVWTFQQSNICINGISAGLWNFKEDRNTVTNGIRLSLIGEGIIAPFAPYSPSLLEDSMFSNIDLKQFGEKINGINIAGTGNLNDYSINGISLGYVGQINSKVNGISAAAFVNYAAIHNGIQMAVFFNDAYIMRGLQIGIFNTSKHTKGVQLGIWNKNEKRKLPIINWNL